MTQFKVKVKVTDVRKLQKWTIWKSYLVSSLGWHFSSNTHASRMDCTSWCRESQRISTVAYMRSEMSSIDTAGSRCVSDKLSLSVTIWPFDDQIHCGTGIDVGSLWFQWTGMPYSGIAEWRSSLFISACVQTSACCGCFPDSHIWL